MSVGSGALWFTATPPTNWLICDGSSLSTAAPYDKLFAVIGYTYGGSGANFNLPPLANVFPVGAGASHALGSTGGGATVTLATANLPSHAHPIVDVAHNHGLNQSGHVHPDPGHAHGATGAQDAHSHGGVVGPQTGGGNLAGQIGGAQYPSTRTDTQQPNVYVSVQAAGTGLQAANANISLNASGTGLSTTQAVGSASPITIPPPPFVGVNFIIKFQ